jgi:hypothetical protein
MSYGDDARSGRTLRFATRALTTPQTAAQIDLSHPMHNIELLERGVLALQEQRDELAARLQEESVTPQP